MTDSSAPHRPAGHPAVPASRVGVLIVNLGTPDAPTPAAVKRYLREFLSDRRVVEIPPLLWQPILRGIILNTRPKKSAHAYAQIWTQEGSPLAVHTRRTATALAERLQGTDVLVDWAMRYGNPSIASRIAAMKEAGCDRILFVPMYPQYSSATTGTAQDALFKALEAMRWQPAIRTVAPWYDDPRYIAALAERVRVHLAQQDRPVDTLLLTFHGMPERTLHLGDPYHCQCRKTARLLADALGRPVEISFQSRFGRAKWLEPSTEDVLARLAQGGAKSIAVMAPGFSVDCLETLEEIALRGRDVFVQNGGEFFAYVPCLNTEERAIDFYQWLIEQNLKGWLD